MDVVSPRPHSTPVFCTVYAKHLNTAFDAGGFSRSNLVSNLIHDIADLKELLISDTYRLPFIVKRY